MRCALLALTLGAVSAVTLVAAPAATASYSGGYYYTQGQCNQAGRNISRDGDWSCTYIASHNPHWHLIIIT